MCPVLSGIYDSEFIQPVAKIKENLAIWTAGQWKYYGSDYQESIVPGPASIFDAIAAAGVTTLAANAALAARIVPILQLNALEFLHIRWEPIDNVEGLIYEISLQKLASSRIHSRVDRNTRNWDPTLASTTFFILGTDRDMRLEVRNPMGYAIPVARFIFWGIRMILADFDLSKVSAADKEALRRGDLETVKRIIGPVTWLPAEGRQS